MTPGSTPWGDPTAPPDRRLAWWGRHAPVVHASAELRWSGHGWYCQLSWGGAAGPVGVHANGETAGAAVDHALSAFNRLIMEPPDARPEPEPPAPPAGV